MKENYHTKPYSFNVQATRNSTSTQNSLWTVALSPDTKQECTYSAREKKTTLKPWQLNVFNVNVYFFGLKILQNMLQTHHVHEMKPDSAIMLVSTLLNLSLYLFQTLPVCKASVIKLRTFLSILVFWARLLFKWFLCSKKNKHIEHTTYTESTTKAKSSTVVNKTACLMKGFN